MNATAKFLQDVYYRFFENFVQLAGGLDRRDRIYTVAETIGRWRARRGYVGRGWSREKYLNTIRVIFPEIPADRADELLRSYWINHQKKFMELFLTRDLDEEKLSGWICFQGLEHLDHALQQGKGVILPVPHIGNERLHHIALAVKGYPMAVISSRYEDHGAFARKVKLDASRRFHEIGHPGDPVWLLKMLKENRILQIACDAEPDANSVLTRFLGQEMYFPSGWVRLALKTGASVLLSALIRLDPDQHLLVLQPAFDLEQDAPRDQILQKNVQRYMDHVAELYQTYPDQVDWMNLTVRLEETSQLRRKNRTESDNNRQSGEASLC
jgi:lauroyl/myristoyl acyltransferase